MQNHSCRITFILALCVLAMSCGTSTQNQRMPISGTASSRPAPSASTASLPPNANIDFRKLPLLEVIFRTQLKVNRLDELYGTTKTNVQHLSVVSNCNLDVLKGFVATGWAPIIALQHSGGKRLWAVTGYDNVAGQIQTANPISRVVRRFSDSDFEREWATGSGNKCVLVTPGRLTEARVNSELGKYLPSAQVSQVKVRSR
ncbi:MAG: hypothetical protein O7E52_18870 [Candidatus Poribacteria bacterium]|nr:hypothetical protein [Candidatus Poribacteria bacterium]